MDRPGRNEPCPCGSGKKFKKCCIHERKPGLDSEGAVDAALSSLDIANSVDPIKDLQEVLAIATDRFEPKNLATSMKFLTGAVEILREDTANCQRTFQLAAIKATKAAVLERDRTSIGDALPEALKEWHFATRMLIRAFFAEVEGTTFAMRRVILWAYDRDEIGLSRDLHFVLSEVRYSSGDGKNVKAHDNYLKPLPGIKLTFREFSSLLGCELASDYGGIGWKSLDEIHDIRNAITHPREVMDMSRKLDLDVLTDTIPKALTWFHENVDGLLSAGQEFAARNPPA